MCTASTATASRAAFLCRAETTKRGQPGRAKRTAWVRPSTMTRLSRISATSPKPRVRYHSALALARGRGRGQRGGHDPPEDTTGGVLAGRGAWAGAVRGGTVLVSFWPPDGAAGAAAPLERPAGLAP